MTRLTILVLAAVVLPVMATASDIAVTVYNGNLGVVSETRTLDFDKGIGRVAFRDVPSQIDASSVRFGLAGDATGVSILEQNYAYDLVSPDQLYRKYIDKSIELLDKDGRLYTGKLMASSSGAVTLMDDNGRVKVVQMAHVTEVNFPSLPEGLITRPTLFWLYNSGSAGSRECDVSYQTGGLGWTAEYVGLLDGDEANLDLSGWASITNNSGKTYTDAKLKLVAGDINRAPSGRGPRRMEKVNVMSAVPESDGFEEKEFFEYHLYTLPRKATVADREQKQVSLFEPASTPVKKEFVYRPDRDPNKVEVTLNFTNSKERGLGIPLPEGRVRLFKADDDGSLILLGEDRIEHTPKDEELNLKVGYAFDIAAEERLMDQQRRSQKVEERRYEIELRNRKDEAITVKVEKKLYGDWTIIESSNEYTKKDAQTLQFEVSIPASATLTFSYTVRYTYR